MLQKGATDIVGNHQLVKLLRDIQDRGAWPAVSLFAGPENVGKFTAAVWFVQRAICQVAPPPCGSCTDCRLIFQHQHFRAQIVLPEEKKELGINDIREIITRYQYKIDEQSGHWLIIPEIQRVSRPALNALLKFLEETPRGLRIIFTSSRIDLVPATIVSRATRYSWPAVPDEIIEHWIERHFPKLPRSERRGYLAYSHGRPGILIQMINDHVDLALDTARFQEWVKQGIMPNLMTSGQDMKNDMNWLQLAYRDLLLFQLGVHSRTTWIDAATAFDNQPTKKSSTALIAALERAMNINNYTETRIPLKHLYHELSLV